MLEGEELIAHGVLPVMGRLGAAPWHTLVHAKGVSARQLFPLPSLFLPSLLSKQMTILGPFSLFRQHCFGAEPGIC